MSDTTRTDELLDDLARPFEDYEIGVLCEHARTLERELNEAREALRDAIEEVEWYESKTGGRTGLSHIKKWRKAAGLEELCT